MKHFPKSFGGNAYETPGYLFDYLNREFKFTWDLASSVGNSKCKQCFVEGREDSLKEKWSDLHGWLWLNPPFRPLKPWIQKCQEESKAGAIVVLCPLIMCTKYFQKHIPSEIRFIAGRVSFLKDGKEQKGNSLSSCILVYNTGAGRGKVGYVDRDAMRNIILK